MKTEPLSRIRYTTKWVYIEKYYDLWILYNFSLNKLRKTETKLAGADVVG